MVAQAGLALAPRRAEMQYLRETLSQNLALMSVTGLAIAPGAPRLEQGEQQPSKP